MYVRISSDPNGTRLGVTRQRNECQAKAHALGWNIAGVYEDNDVSAYTGKRRPAYERMLDDLRAGTITAVVVWDLDRLTRRPIEIEHFIDLADTHHVALASVGEEVDLSTDNGRLFARIKGAVARSEVERKSARMRSATQQRLDARKPNPGGRRLYGYTRTYSINPAEAAHLRAVADIILAGGTLRAAVRHLEQAGARTVLGNTWRPTELRRSLTNPMYAGLLTHNGQVVGESTHEGIWDTATYAALKTIIDDPARKRMGPPRRYLLSGVARCATCGARAYGCTQPEPRGAAYGCESRKHFLRTAGPIEDYVTDHLLERLTRPDAAELITPKASTDEAAALRRDEIKLRARLDGLAEAFAAGDIDASQLQAGSKRARTDLDRVTAHLAALAQSPAVAALVSADDITHEWTSMDIDVQRDVVSSVMDVKILGLGRGVRTFKPESVQIGWKTA